MAFFLNYVPVALVLDLERKIPEANTWQNLFVQQLGLGKCTAELIIRANLYPKPFLKICIHLKKKPKTFSN